jgi:uncharacterized protein (DUF433 family)
MRTAFVGRPLSSGASSVICLTPTIGKAYNAWSVTDVMFEFKGSTMVIEEYFDFSHPDEIRLAGHRINIETILVEYLDGMVPEEIAAQHPTLSLEQVYATITYYWRNQSKLALYLQEARELEDKLQREQVLNPSPSIVRMRQLRRQQKQSSILEHV